MKEFWNQRYAEPDFVYGTQPNQFFKEVIDAITPGTMLLPCEGAYHAGEAEIIRLVALKPV